MAREVSDLLILLNEYKKDDPKLWNILKRLIDLVGFSQLRFDGVELPANSREKKGVLLYDRFHRKFQLSENNRDFVDVQPHERARIYNDANIAIATGVVTTLTFNTVRYDTDTLYSATNPSRLTARWPGNYSIGAGVRFEANAVGVRLVTLRLNGTTMIATSLVPNAGGAIQQTLNVNTDYELVPTDYVEVQVFQDSGGPLNAVRFVNTSPEFWIRRNT